MSNTNAVTNTQDPYSGATIAGLMPSFNTPTLLGVDARDGTKTSRPLSELGNAARLTDKYSGDIYYVHQANAWLIWRNGAWSWNVGGAEVRRLATLLPDKTILLRLPTIAVAVDVTFMPLPLVKLFDVKLIAFPVVVVARTSN